MTDLMDALERAVADPNNQSYAVVYVRRMRSIAAEGSAGDGRVVATVNGYGTLMKMRIAPEALHDVPRLERLVREAVNRAADEAERQAPPPPLFPPMIDPTDFPEAPLHGDPPPTPGVRAWIRSVVRAGPEQMRAYLDAIPPIAERVAIDESRLPSELGDLLQEVSLRLGDPRLSAASVRRSAGIEDPSILRRFRRSAGVSLTTYIEHRRMETAARLVYASDLPFEEIASMLGFASAQALANAIEIWSGFTLAELRELWADGERDYVVWRWVGQGVATLKQVEQVIADFKRLYPDARIPEGERARGPGPRPG